MRAFGYNETNGYAFEEGIFSMTVTDRFLTYVGMPTMSDEDSPTVPSTEKQLRLAEHLAAELSAMGLSGVRTDRGYVYAHLPEKDAPGAPAIGFIAHIDTSPEAADAPIRPREIRYEGGDVTLDAERDIRLSPADFPCLSRCVGQRLIVTDGATLLGADDKAGMAEIVTALETLIASGAPHGKICVAFTPDEEIGRGADLFDVAGFGAEYAYTVDGGALGEVEYENFNAADAKLVFHGRSIHPGDGKGRMKNAALMACEFNAMLPPWQIPARTEGYEGFHHLLSIEGGVEEARSHYIIRDHDRAKFEEKKALFQFCARRICELYGPDAAELSLTDSYYNMKERVEPYPHIVERAKAALRAEGVEPNTVPIRGGTDGARLSFMGLPCPNLCTGGANYHSRFEFVSIDAMETMVRVLCRLMAGK